MRYSENALNILTVRTFPQKGPAWISKNLRGNEDLYTICQLLDTNSDEFLHRRYIIETKILKLMNYADGLVAFGDSDFPMIRGTVKSADKPFAIFYKGDIGLLREDNLNIAVIGLLNPDSKIEQIVRLVTSEILKHNATIVSGLALGCDSIAHKTALECGGKTIAILPSPLNNIQPKENIELANQIVANGGLLISEYYEDHKSRNDLISRYVVRDRLQALFSDAVLLTASYAPNEFGNDCGSRHAMDKAKAYGIKRGIVYNHTKHHNIAMYDLNRQIFAEDKTVVRIDSDNMRQEVTRLVTPNITRTLF